MFEAILERSPGIDVETFKKTFEPILAEYTSAGKFDAIPEANYRTLDTLIGLGKAVMILTSRTHTELQHLLKPDHVLAQRVQAFYYRDNTQFHKPDPRVFKELLTDNQLLPDQCVYVGDSISDAVAAKQAGLHFVVSLESGLRQQHDFDGLFVDVFIQRFPDVVGAVVGLETS